MGDILEKLNSVFPDCEVFESTEDVLKARCPEVKKFYRHKFANGVAVYCAEEELKHDKQPLYCNYHGQLRVVDDPACQYHLESFDPWCWERCETEWAIKRLRPALSTAYKHHKDSTPQKAQVLFVDGVSGNLWGDR
jgi:hypothetical protein